jgi:probable F420-dependent oxidoreductase
MKLGAAFGNDSIGLDFSEIRDVVQALEDVGFDSVSTNDHVVGGHPDRLVGDEKMHLHTTAVHEPLVLLSFIGAVTERLELVTSVLLLPQRQTTLVAKQVAELDLLSGGRVRLGVGIGRNWMEYEALNENFTNRGKRIEEQIEVLRRYWTDDLITFNGQWHDLDRIGLNPMPIQRPIPIWMGSYFGRIVEKVLERIGRLADGWMPQFPADQLAPVLERVRGYAADAGRDPADLGVECIVRINADDDVDQWIERAKAFADLGATHLKVGAARGFATPAERAAGLVKWHQAVAPELAP